MKAVFKCHKMYDCYKVNEQLNYQFDTIVFIKPHLHA